MKTLDLVRLCFDANDFCATVAREAYECFIKLCFDANDFCATVAAVSMAAMTGCVLMQMISVQQYFKRLATNANVVF